MRNPRAGAALRRTLADQRALVAHLADHARARGEIGPATDSEAVARMAVAILSGLMLQRALESGANLRPSLELARTLLATLSEQPGHSRSEGVGAQWRSDGTTSKEAT